MPACAHCAGVRERRGWRIGDENRLHGVAGVVQRHFRGQACGRSTPAVFAFDSPSLLQEVPAKGKVHCGRVRSGSGRQQKAIATLTVLELPRAGKRNFRTRVHGGYCVADSRHLIAEDQTHCVDAAAASPCIGIGEPWRCPSSSAPSIPPRARVIHGPRQPGGDAIVRAPDCPPRPAGT